MTSQKAGGPDELPPQREYDIEMKRRNYARAAMVAEEGGLGDEHLRAAREKAFKQFLGEWFNFNGAEAVAREWGFSRADVSRLCAEIVEAVEGRETREGRELLVFDIGRMDHTKVIKLVNGFRDRYR